MSSGNPGIGLGRSMLIRRLVRLEHQRRRKLRGRAMLGDGITARPLRAMIDWLENGVLWVPQGRAMGLGFDMRYLPISHAHTGAIAHGILEVPVQEALVRHLGAGDVLYDLGANIGFFSLLGAQLTGPDGGVYAFEVAPDNAAAIRRNAELNGLTNVTVIERAVSSGPGVGRLQVVDDQSWSKLVQYGEHPLTERVIEVELAAIDDLARSEGLPAPNVVKIDVEGAEIAALEGMRRTIDEHRPAIICELHDTRREFVNAMSDHGYRLVNLERATAVAEDPDAVHVLALPPGAPGE